eukprot:403343825
MKDSRFGESRIENPSLFNNKKLKETLMNANNNFSQNENQKQPPHNSLKMPDSRQEFRIDVKFQPHSLNNSQNNQMSNSDYIQNQNQYSVDFNRTKTSFNNPTQSLSTKVTETANYSSLLENSIEVEGFKLLNNQTSKDNLSKSLNMQKKYKYVEQQDQNLISQQSILDSYRSKNTHLKEFLNSLINIKKNQSLQQQGRSSIMGIQKPNAQSINRGIQIIKIPKLQESVHIQTNNQSKSNSIDRQIQQNDISLSNLDIPQQGRFDNIRIRKTKRKKQINNLPLQLKQQFTIDLKSPFLSSNLAIDQITTDSQRLLNQTLDLEGSSKFSMCSKDNQKYNAATCEKQVIPINKFKYTVAKHKHINIDEEDGFQWEDQDINGIDRLQQVSQISIKL